MRSSEDARRAIRQREVRAHSTDRLGARELSRARSGLRAAVRGFRPARLFVADCWVATRVSLIAPRLSLIMIVLRGLLVDIDCRGCAGWAGLLNYSFGEWLPIPKYNPKHFKPEVWFGKSKYELILRFLYVPLVILIVLL